MMTYAQIMGKPELEFWWMETLHDHLGSALVSNTLTEKMLDTMNRANINMAQTYDLP
jgi:hypothetical protein